MTTLQKLECARQNAREQGFTLVELAIVLVIIGLIIGGVLVGQDLIKAAEIRATVSQIEQFNAAVNTFRGRYQGIPGDIRNVTSFFDTTTWENLSNGNGNRVIELCAAAAVAPDPTVPTPNCTDPGGGASFYTAVTQALATPLHSGEAVQFWHHLSAAELIPGFYDGLTTLTGITTAGKESGTEGISFPVSKMDRNGIGVYGVAGKNYYQIGAHGNATTDDFEIMPSLTPEEASNLDGKMDDGKPGSGSIIVRSSAVSPATPDLDLVAADGDFTASPTTTTACLTGPITVTTPADITASARASDYALLNTDIACSIRIRMN